MAGAALAVGYWAASQRPWCDIPAILCSLCGPVDSKRAAGEPSMYTKMLVPLDGSDTAEKALPYARSLSRALKLPVELLAVVDLSEMAAHVAAGKARYLDSMIEASVRSSEEYLQ